MDLARMRHEYETAGLTPDDVDPDPIVQFRTWFDQAVAAEITEPNAMSLATVDADGRPGIRHVLLKGISEGGFEFYTNRESRKGRAIAAEARVALVFPWLQLHRQVVIDGVAEPLTDAESDDYFAKRPRTAQLGAWASPQSRVLDGRAELDRRLADAEAGFPDEVPRPPHWGGYRVMPDVVEFWQGRPSRLHDRIVHVRSEDGWRIERRSP